MTKKVPLVVYHEVDGKQVRVVIGEGSVDSHGLFTGEITNDAGEHIFKAIMGGGGKFSAQIGLDGKYVMKQSPIDGMPK